MKRHQAPSAVLSRGKRPLYHVGTLHSLSSSTAPSASAATSRPSGTGVSSELDSSRTKGSSSLVRDSVRSTSSKRRNNEKVNGSPPAVSHPCCRLQFDSSNKRSRGQTVAATSETKNMNGYAASSSSTVCDCQQRQLRKDVKNLNQAFAFEPKRTESTSKRKKEESSLNGNTNKSNHESDIGAVVTHVESSSSSFSPSCNDVTASQTPSSSISSSSSISRCPPRFSQRIREVRECAAAKQRSNFFERKDDKCGVLPLSLPKARRHSLSSLPFVKSESTGGRRSMAVTNGLPRHDNNHEERVPVSFSSSRSTRFTSTPPPITASASYKPASTSPNQRPKSKQEVPPTSILPSNPIVETPKRRKRPSRLKACPFDGKENVHWHCSRCQVHHWVENRNACHPFQPKHGFRFERIPEDGDCFFTCIYRALKSDSTYLEQLNRTRSRKNIPTFNNLPSVKVMREMVSDAVGQDQLEFYQLQAMANPNESWLSFFRSPLKNNESFSKCDSTDSSSSSSSSSSLDGEEMNERDLLTLEEEDGIIVREREESHLTATSGDSSSSSEENEKNSEEGFVINSHDNPIDVDDLIPYRTTTTGAVQAKIPPRDSTTNKKKRKRKQTVIPTIQTLPDLKSFIKREGSIFGSNKCLWADSFAHKIIADQFHIQILFVDMERAKDAWPYRVLAGCRSEDVGKNNKHTASAGRSDHNGKVVPPIRYVVMKRHGHGHFSLLSWQENEGSKRLRAFSKGAISNCVVALWGLEREILLS